MEFETLLKKISPILKIIAKSHNGHGFFIDEEDLYQEMCIHLWSNFGNGMRGGVNTSYIVKSCEFYILNYLRKAREKARIVSLEEPINEDGDTLKDILPDRKEPLDKFVDRDLTIKDIRNNGLTRRGKKVLYLLLKGLTVREAGKELGVSHVMVVKVKNRIIRKWQRKIEGYQKTRIFT
ncbi:MAG: sigma-70 family RNA polymerase sigma factor [Elusimicrobiota bacterium]|nr:sigma-70 family RNA polymerase sigma factor [Elusimicrobiota bacterium]MDH5661962.1 sigma-70 family RNA polymerase sigma factor [Elusimicrobiota bacterium]